MKRFGLVALAVIALGVGRPSAQGQRGGAPAGPPPPAQTAAPIDLTGYWVSIVNEDWRWRMLTPPKGDYASVAGVMSADGRGVADKWTAAMDGRCEAYGAGGLMRMPTRVHITWQDDNTLKVETDAGTQTRLFHFGRGNPPSAPERSLQGYSVATWEVAGGGRGAARGGAAQRFGSLKVVTTSLREGWLRKNGVPYSENTTMTEFYDRFKSTNGDDWFFVTTIINDPKYLTQEFVTSSHFKKEADGSKWSPSSCRTS